jgi:hypothetical protein
MNPYDILSITAESSLHDIKMSYYNMAQYCHPLYGGSVHDMCILHAAYLWTTTPTMQLIPFEEFTKMSYCVPPYATIVNDAFNIDHEVLSMYGDFMVPIVQAEILRFVKDNDNVSRDSIIDHVKSLDSKVKQCVVEPNNNANDNTTQYESAFKVPEPIPDPTTQGQYTAEPPYWK